MHLAARIVGLRLGIPLDLHLVTRRDRLTLTLTLTLPLTVDHVILATGPAHGGVITDTPALADFAALGLLPADSMGLGLLTSLQGHAMQLAGASDASLLVAGPLARGRVGELMGLPELIYWAEHIAREAALQIRQLLGRLAEG